MARRPPASDDRGLLGDLHGNLHCLPISKYFFQRPTVDLPISREQLSSHGTKQLAADLLNASGGELPKHAKEPYERTETAHVLETFGSWVHILVNGKSDLQNSWRCLNFSSFHLLFRVDKLQQMAKKKYQTAGNALHCLSLINNFRLYDKVCIVSVITVFAVHSLQPHTHNFFFDKLNSIRLFPGGCFRCWNRFPFSFPVLFCFVCHCFRFEAWKSVTIATGYAILRKIAHLIT